MVEEDGQCPGLQACCEVGTQHASQTCWVDMWAGVEELFWKKYAHYSCEGDRVEGIQKVIMDLIDEFKDEFPTILRLSQSNQKREPMQKPSKIRMAIALAKINRGTLIQGLNSISRSSKSVAKLLQPQLACRLLELRAISHRLLKEVNAPRQPLYNIQECWLICPERERERERSICLWSGRKRLSLQCPVSCLEKYVSRSFQRNIPSLAGKVVCYSTISFAQKTQSVQE
ncbi:spermatogenesis-associated protein 9 isoform X5 [Bos javanicus]|uniref:spermatogenesis-associated protein 9 isoform X5 n=1 Tax=Bos javanicus TaxID=9906 RepID=UPI002AA8A824|nr:spermatogenesis-associated protein 9 isoform X5 [Bos javanicus]